MLTSALIASVLVGAAVATPFGPPFHHRPPPHHHTTVHHTTKHTTTHHHTTKTTTTPPPSKGTLITADFDDLTPPAGGAAIGLYEYLQYNDISVAALVPQGTVAAANVAGIQPESSPNVAYYSAGTGNNPEITADFVNTNVEYFAFSSFYFGCADTTNGAISGNTNAANCTITVTGYRKGRPTGIQAFDFVVANKKTVSPMQFVSLNSNFDDVDTVDFSTDGTNKGIATLLDNFVYTIY